MKGLAILGVLLILGGIALVVGPSITTQKKVIDAGPIQVSKDEEHKLPVSPIAGAIAVAAGVALIVAGRKSS
jgi:hypothetical protein